MLDALEVAREQLAIAERVFARDSPDRFQCFFNVWKLAFEAGIYEESREIGEEWLRQALRVLGGCHTEIASASLSLAATLVKLARDEEAESAYKRVVDVHERLAPRDLPFKLIAYLDPLADTQARLRKFPDAEATSRRRLSLLRQHARHAATDIATQLVKIGMLLAEQSRHAEAEAAINEAVQVLEERFAADSPSLIQSLKVVAELCDAPGRPPLAAIAAIRARLSE